MNEPPATPRKSVNAFGTERPAFVIGGMFHCGGKIWRCTDIGTRVITAICLDRVAVGGTDPACWRTLGRAEAAQQGWFNGPPYAGVEHVFDENSQGGCRLIDDGDGVR